MLQCVYVDRSFISLGVSGALLRSRRALPARSMLSMIHACEQVVEIEFSESNSRLSYNSVNYSKAIRQQQRYSVKYEPSIDEKRSVEKRADCEREHLTPCSSHTSTSNGNLFLATTSKVRTHFWRGGSAKNTWICMQAANSMSLLTHTHCTALVHVCRLDFSFCSRTESAALSGIKKLTISLCEVALALCSASHVKIYKSNWISAAWQAAQWIGISGTAWKKPFATLEWSGSSDFQSTNERLQENKNKNY